MKDDTLDQLPTLSEYDYDVICDRAHDSLREYSRGIKGQMITPRDGIEWHVMKETESYILSMLKEGKPTMNETCVWFMNEDIIWLTGCRNHFDFIDASGPEANGFVFCPFCGYPIQIAPVSKEADDD